MIFDCVPSALSTDLHELTTAISYLRRQMVGPATFTLWVRELPPDRGYLVWAGLADCLDHLESLRLTPDEVGDVAGMLGLTAADRARLRRLRFTGEVWAVPEGTVVTAGMPLLEITAPIAEAQLVETALLTLVTYQTAAATAAARCRLAAAHAQLLDVSMRRAAGLEAARQTSRATALAGWDATSNLAAVRAFGLAAGGTMGHAYVAAFPAEAEAFSAYAADFPDRTTFVVDTFDALDGVRAAIDVIRGRGLGDRAGIRLSGGDLRALAVQARGLLDGAGLPGVRILAGDGLDEHAIDALARSGAPIDAYGVGSAVARPPAPWTAYALTRYGERPIAAGSVLAGRTQVFRGADLHVHVGVRDEPAPAGTAPLLAPVLAGGRRLDPGDTVEGARRRCADDLARLTEAQRRLTDPEPLRATPTPELTRCVAAARHAARPGAPVDAAPLPDVAGVAG